MLSKMRLLFVAFLLFVSLPQVFGQATIILINGDPDGVGLNDPEPRDPIAGNNGTTLGEQRLNVVARAMEIWGELLDTPVPIRVLVTTALQPCDATSAVLASAGTTQVFFDFANAPLADTWYHSSLADAIAGAELDSSEGADISTRFNLNLDEDPVCLGGNGWYYGFDHNEGNQSDLLATMLHELGHGLGFADLIGADGEFFNGRPDVYASNLRDLEVGLDWTAMTAPQRAASSINDPDLVWTGPSVTEIAPTTQNPLVLMDVTAPGSIAGNYPIQLASFGPDFPAQGLTGEVVLLTDATDPFNDGCETATNGAEFDGKVVLIDRGNCNFTAKVLNAQAFGAIAVLIANNSPDGLPPMGGDDPSVDIPSVGISQALGTAIKNELTSTTVTVEFSFSETEFQGGNSGFMRMNAPDPFSGGSSVSHWTPDAEPSLLMEPAITPFLTDDVDLTPNLFEDIGWPLLGQCTPTQIDSQTPTTSYCDGETVTINISATGTQLSYQWRKDGVNITGATDPTYEIVNASADDAGAYSCRITSACDQSVVDSDDTLLAYDPVVFNNGILAKWLSESSDVCEDINDDRVIDMLDLVGILNNTPAAKVAVAP